MDWLKLRNDNEVVEIQVPPSLLAFLRKWAKEGKHSVDNCALSLFSHGLVSLLALNGFDPELVAQVHPILEDMCADPPKNAHILEVTLVRETRAHVHNANGG